MTTASGSVVYMFPGQSSRRPEMIAGLIHEWPQGAAVLSLASDILERDLAAQFDPANPEIFARNRDIQVGVFIANYIHMLRLEQAGVMAQWSLGLSLGEYNHLVHIGAITFENALPLVEMRGELFETSAPGAMLAIFPIEAEIVQQTIAALGLADRVAIGLYNAPRQQVLSGDREAVSKIVAALEDEAFLEAVEIEARIPIHSSIMAPVAASFKTTLARAEFQTPHLPYVPNATGRPIVAPSPDMIRELLVKHVVSPVQWRGSVDAVAAEVPHAHFVEAGPGTTLYSMFGRGWSPGRRFVADRGRNWREGITRLTAELAHGS
jgi:[acyl-carrier-protein] S-malonyltransferase